MTGDRHSKRGIRENTFIEDNISGYVNFARTIQAFVALVVWGIAKKNAVFGFEVQLLRFEGSEVRKALTSKDF